MIGRTKHKKLLSKLWAPKHRIEVSYLRSIRKLTKAILNRCKKAKTPDEIIRILQEYAVSPKFIQDAKGLSLKMVTALFVDGKKTWREAAEFGTRGTEIRRELKKELHGQIGIAVDKAIKRNAQLISSLPLSMAERASKMAQKAAYGGRRADEVAEKILSSMGDISVSRAKLIARTEVAKAQTDLKRARCEELGVNWYIWHNSHDERVRKSHRKMEGILINWNDPPSPERLAKEKYVYGNYHAGQIFNCRCYAEPITDIDDIEAWPVKVYYNGSIQRMTRKQFLKIGGAEFNEKQLF